MPFALSPSRLCPHLLAALLLAVALPARAQDHPAGRETYLWRTVSGKGNLAFLVLGVARPLLLDHATHGTWVSGGNRTARTLDTLAVSSLLTEALKYDVREKRPDTDERNSFPSGHASAAFAVATMESQFHPREAPFWYLGAALIGYSRIRLHRHFVHDVLAGGVLGIATARVELAQPHGLILTPLIRPARKQVGMTLTAGF